MKKTLLFSIGILAAVLLSGCTNVQNESGIFYHLFVLPFEFGIYEIGTLLNGNFGLSIIIITLIIRLILMPSMLKNYRNQQVMKEKMNGLKPEMDEIQKRLKAAESKEEQMTIQQEMMGLYKKHGVNPLNMGCLPLLIQMPILMGLYFAISYSEEIATHSFLWFNLGSPDILMMLIAGAIYFVQGFVTLNNLPEAQKKQMKIITFISPIMIMFISFSAPAALPLYWAVGGAFLIIQTLIGQRFYQKHPEKALEAAQNS
ncbi:membrane protein insertase YidC [Jeotgalibacillus sp. ET6]|uniref:membrane protein insertase YidC n=1 Tax=Jeotgalibacillus sp. ET6 TaxID=3037260 RepID=UPI002418843D|nr:membrane protein insertase YidC [Jeotgalibacillus sp. ET6]MDG5472878.1 membrane protein insertase YidC [Jeotgalibacillus sp. ET6]